MEFNWKFIGQLAIFVAICIGVLACFSVDRASAFNDTDVVIDIPYITQGEVVYVGDTVDISGVVPPYPQLAYWDGHDMYDSAPSYNFTMSDYKRDYYKFNISSEVFGNRLGNWYKYSGVFEPRGNNIAFVVKSKPMTNYTMTLQNGTVLNLTSIHNVTYTPYVMPKPTILPEKHIADYLVTREESFNISVDDTSAVWVFNGRNNDILYSKNNTALEVIFDQSTIQNIEPGEYKIVIQSIGNFSNGLDVIYDQHNSIIKWFDRENFKVHQIDATNLEPESAITLFKQIFPHVPDQYQIKKLAVQEPEITIVSMDKLYSANAKEYFHDIDMIGNVTLMDVRGYTNVLPGTNITVTLDETKTDPRLISKTATFRGKAEGEYLGDMRQYRIYVPLYWDSLSIGVHTLTARTEKGGVMYADFVVSELPEDSYVPEAKLRYVEDRNPWVPTPTPEVVKVVETREVIKPIEVPVTPSPEQVAEAQRKISEEEWNKNVALAAIVIVCGIVLIISAFGIKYLVSVYRRVKKND